MYFRHFAKYTTPAENKNDIHTERVRHQRRNLDAHITETHGRVHLLFPKLSYRGVWDNQRRILDSFMYHAISYVLWSHGDTVLPLKTARGDAFVNSWSAIMQTGDGNENNAM